MLACQKQYCYHKKIEQDTEEEVGDATGHLKPSLIVAEHSLMHQCTTAAMVN